MTSEAPGWSYSARRRRDHSCAGASLSFAYGASFAYGEGRAVKAQHRRRLLQGHLVERVRAPRLRPWGHGTHMDHGGTAPRRSVPGTCPGRSGRAKLSRRQSWC